jgi:hypothetical protein
LSIRSTAEPDQEVRERRKSCVTAQLAQRSHTLIEDLERSGKGQALSWKPLSVRDGRAKDQGPYEGVPPHLYSALKEWVDSTFGGYSEQAGNDIANGPRLAAALRYSVFARPGRKLTVREVTLSLNSQIDLMLEAVDAVLHLERPNRDLCRQLDELLTLGGSVWQVGPTRDRLVRRVDPTAAASFGEASSPRDLASAELKEAWTAAYGRNPDASDAWDHSIKAVEAVLIPAVTPNNAKATLGVVIKTLNDQGDLWRLALQGHDRSESVAPLVSVLRLMWPNPDRHGGAGSRQPALVEAQTVVHLAVTIVQWARSGVLSKKLRSLRGFVFLHHRCRNASTFVDLHPALFGPCSYRGRIGALPRATHLMRPTACFACMLDVLAERAS